MQTKSCRDLRLPSVAKREGITPLTLVCQALKCEQLQDLIASVLPV